MIRCPQCEFENPDNHKFCQECGSTIVDAVDIDAIHRRNDQAESLKAEVLPRLGNLPADTERLAILSLTDAAQARITANASQPLSAVVDYLQQQAIALQQQEYLDGGDRYRITAVDVIMPEPNQGIEHSNLEITVIDTQLGQVTHFDQAIEQTHEKTSHPGAPDSTSSIKDAIPSQALTYLAVQDHLYPSLPQIHDAWILGDFSAILLENRHHYPTLVNLMQEPSISPLQVLHWFHEMTELWAVLLPHQYQQSLITLDNLRVDEDHILCLKRLYRVPAGQDIGLKNIGQVWRQLLDGSILQENPHLSAIYQHLEQGTIESLDQLRLRLEEAALQLHEEESKESPKSPEPDISSVTDPIDPFEVAPTKPIEAPSTSSATLLEEDEFLGQDTADESLEVCYEGDEAPTVVLPMRLFNLVDAGLTDIGRQRDHNEDYFSIQSDIQKQDTPTGRLFSARGLYILCDGMGGHAAGEVASALAVSTLNRHFDEIWSDQFPSPDTIQAAIQKANQSIYQLNQENAYHGSGRMGTTLVMMLVDGIHVAIAHVGDSRLYRFCRRTGLEQLTVDHEVGQREIQRGMEPSLAYARPDAYQLTQALGPRDDAFIKPDIQTFEVNEDSLFLLCSDGLSDNDLLEKHCDDYVEPMLSSQTNLEQGLHRLVDLANQQNGHDNITAIAVRMKVRPKLQEIQQS